MHFDPRDGLASTEAGRAKLVQALMANSLGSAGATGVTDPKDLPRRFLPPGKYQDLYRVYVAEAFATQQPCASASTFFRTLRKSGWRKKLRFRGYSTHAECTTCHKLKSRIRCCKDIQTHASAADKLMRHLAGTFADRQVYMQHKSRAATQRDVICCIVDSMDKSKFRLPRFAGGRVPKALEKKKRPELELTACILHGRCMLVYLTDCDLSTGADWSLEVLSRSLDKAFLLAQQKNEPWPMHVKFWSDNTPKAPWPKCFEHCVILNFH